MYEEEYMNDDTGDWDDELGNNFGVALNLDPETRVWEVRARGNASMLMFLLLDVSEHSLMNKLFEEAKFDQVVANMGEIGDGTEG
tara:strand:- start:1597 stop:1851 length:255 start_codon:yes stop_codon:yes gene_type:complete